ncbi:methylated-DNA--[protein]-cysteine S-methyltransferase [Lactococcus nasutitermitis]|uniref:Methylated-DNA--protein-cysteine methyltransferase n=1 Tax=Lactococcus nasutitermitis TaxID=1652957 RepID=A0ABV9JFT3_9LACT|nr:methylated-DNA--[protein]-cysteine S-methyltransferase [Lactococcus nasutitermitis]
MNYKTRYASPVGRYLLTSDGENLTGCYLENQKYFPEMAEFEEKDLPIFEQTKNWLDAYFAGEKPKISELMLAPVGSDFRQNVWRILCEIPVGQTTTYGEIARKLGIKSGQAIGGAVGHNPISVIIPCHRVLGADGSLTGYAGGLSAKRYLLALEGIDLPEQLNLF